MSGATSPPRVARYGFTGTRTGMTEAQLAWLATTLERGAPVHHGGCVGADAQMHHHALAVGSEVTVHPPINPKLRMPDDPRALWLPAKDYLARDRDIVDSTDLLLATPDGPPRPRSGTWYTIDYATRTGKPVIICYPDGTVEHR